MLVLLKLVLSWNDNRIDNLIDQVRKFQNSYFNKHLWKAKACILRACYEICS